MAEFVQPIALATTSSGIAPAGQTVVTQRNVDSYSLMFNPNKGLIDITGIADLAANGFASLAVLHTSKGHPLTVASVNATGEYIFEGLSPGHYVVSLFDSTGTYKSETLHTVVPYSPIVIQGDYLPAYNNSVYSSGPLSLVNAEGAVTWSIVDGVLPAGLSMAPNGVISGTPTTEQASNFTVRVIDQNGAVGTAAKSITVGPSIYQAQFVRLHITDNNGDATYVSIPEIEMAHFVGGIDQCVGGTALASSEANGSNTAAMAFDNNMTDKWTSGAGKPTVGSPQWIQYNFGSVKSVDEVRISGPISGQLSTAAKDFEIRISNNGTTWTTVKTFTGITDWAVQTFKSFKIT